MGYLITSRSGGLLNHQQVKMGSLITRVKSKPKGSSSKDKIDLGQVGWAKLISYIKSGISILGNDANMVAHL